MKKAWTAAKKIWKLTMFLFLLLLTFGYALLQGGFVSWFLFYSFLPFAFYCSVIVFFPLKGFEVVRVLPKNEYNAGEPLKVNVMIRRRNSFPLFYLLASDQLAASLKNSPQKRLAQTLLLPGFKKEFSYEYIIDELKRGEYVFHSLLLKIGDPLGLTEKEMMVHAENRIIVYPACTGLLYRPFEQQYDQGMTASRERVQRDSTMAVSVREYQPGDRFSWVNWKASAKRNEMMTKEFEQRQSHDVMVIMDGVPDTRFEAIVSFTASFLKAVLEKGAQTGLLTHSDERALFPVRGGEKHLQEMFYHLARIEAKGRQPLEKVLETDKLPIQQTDSFFLITASLSRALIVGASFLGKRKGIITIVLIKGAGESLTEMERGFMAMAKARGVRVKSIHEGNFAEAFSVRGSFGNA